jgi:general secretion pathway protein I
MNRAGCNGCKRASCRGFSLIEVLVAFAILTLALGVLLPLFSNGFRSLSVSEQYTRAAVLAESRMAAIGRETSLEEGEQAGESEQGFQWRTEVTRYEPLDDTEEFVPLVQAFVATVEVYWQDGDKRRALTLNSLKLRPAS